MSQLKRATPATDEILRFGHKKIQKLRVALCEDELATADYIKSLLIKWAGNRNCMLHMKYFPYAEAFRFYCGDCLGIGCSWDLLLLDIEMQSSEDGLVLAKKLREKGCIPAIIFITGYKEFVFDGYMVSALNYLVKPVKEELLFETLDKALLQMAASAENEARILVFETTEGMHVRFNENDIIFAEAMGHYTCLTAFNGEYRLRLSLTELAAQLNPVFFCRPHRSYIAGIKHISSITKNEIILDNGTYIPLSRLRYKEINDAFLKYYRGNSDV